MDQDYSEHPKSITEIKAERTCNAKDNTPRDVLIRTLRDIDNGAIKPEALVLVYRVKDEDDEWVVHNRISSPDGHVTSGMLAESLFAK